jgi:hypothetical protein
LFVLSRLEALNHIREAVYGMNGQAEKYKAAHDGQCPSSFADFAPQFADKPNDPLGGVWTWDPAACMGGASSAPNVLNMSFPQI